LAVQLEAAATRFACDSRGGFNDCIELTIAGEHWASRGAAAARGWRWWSLDDGSGGSLLCPACAAAIKPLVSRAPVRKNEKPILLWPVKC